MDGCKFIQEEFPTSYSLSRRVAVVTFWLCNPYFLDLLHYHLANY